MKSSGLSRLTPYLLSVLRIVVASLFIAHGTQKLFAFPASTPSRPTFSLQSKLGVAGAIEAGGGALMLVGLFSRPVAFILSGEMAFAYFTQHAPSSPWPLVNGGELAVLYCFTWLFLVAAGPGPLSLDAVIRKRA